MKNLNEYPTPITDDLCKNLSNSDRCDWEKWQITASKCADLERKLAAYREALEPFAKYEKIRITMGGTTPKSGPWMAVCASNGDAEITVEDMQNAIKTLAATAP